MARPTRTNPVERRRKAARRLLIVPSPDGEERSVFVLRRFDSGALLAAGIAEILGPQAIVAAQEQAVKDRDRETLLAMAPEGSEHRAALEAEIRADLEKRNAEFADTLAADPARQVAFLRRCDAYAMGAVEAMGIARDDAPDGVQPPGTATASVCRPLVDEPKSPDDYVQRVTIVQGPAASDAELPIYELSMPERVAIGWAAIAVLEVASQLRPFRGGPGDARAR